MSDGTWKNWPLYLQRQRAMQDARYFDAELVQVELDQSATTHVKELVGWVYQVLSILDAKASALMRLNGVQIAAAAFVLGMFGPSTPKNASILSTSRWDALVISWSVLLSAVSICLCLFVVRVGWAFLDKVDRKGDSTFDFTNEIRELVAESERRQRVYRAAWWFSAGASALFVFEFLWQACVITLWALKG